MRLVLLCLSAVLGASLLCAESAAADECWIHTPPGYQRIGGASRIGPYKDWYEANRVNNQYFQGGGSIHCSRSTGGGGTPRFKYGAAKFHNRTSGTISFSVRRKPGGTWETVRVKSGSWHWWWQECPCRFHCRWDGSFKSGYQTRTREAYWFGYGYKPNDKDARDWQFVQRGDRIDLIAGSSAPIPNAQPRPKPKPRGSARVSFTGGGTGNAHHKTLRSSKVASGTWYLNFFPRVNGMIPSLSGTWTLTWKKVVGNRNAPARSEVWTLRMKGLRGSTRSVVDVTLTGGAGTASYVTTRVPLHTAAGLIKLKVGIGFNGKAGRLTFTQAY